MAVRKNDIVRLSGSQTYAEYLLMARREFEAGRAATLKDLRAVYVRTAADIRRDIENVTAGTLRHGHLSALATNLERRAKELNRQVLDATQKGIWLSSSAGVQGPASIAEHLLGDTFDPPEIRRLFAGINERAVLAMLSRTRRDGLMLSDRVWRVGEKTRAALTRLVEDGVARGLDARILAKDVQKYLQPGVNTVHKLEVRRRLGISKDISYEAMRLARTEMNNAFHEGMIAANHGVPSYRGIYWRLSDAHPAPDVCDDMAEDATHGEPGFYPKAHEPVRPHPQCYCVTMPAYEDPQQFTERLRQWGQNPSSQPDIEEWYNKTARGFLKRPGGLSSVLAQAVNAAETVFLWHGWSKEAAREAYVKGEELRQLSQQANVEYAAMLDAETGTALGGNIKGRASTVTIQEHIEKMQPGKRYIQIHTHPGSSAFSDGDVKLLYYHQQHERFLQSIHVVGVDGKRYVISRQSAALTVMPEDIEQAFYAEIDRLWPAWERRSIAGELSREEAWKQMTHEVWSNIAGRLGLKYDRLE